MKIHAFISVCWLLSFSALTNTMLQAAFHSTYHVRKREVEVQQSSSVLTSRQTLWTEVDILLTLPFCKSPWIQKHILVLHVYSVKITLMLSTKKLVKARCTLSLHLQFWNHCVFQKTKSMAFGWVYWTFQSTCFKCRASI